MEGIAMLTLSRKAGQGIWIGDVFFRVVKASADKVTLAIFAPPEIRILREELDPRPTPQPKVRRPKAQRGR
jgi:carbon storage regulator CsrA